MAKLLQINTVVNYGSTGKIVEAIGNKVLQNGWESYIIYGRYPRTSSSKTIKIGNKISIVLHYFQKVFLCRHGLGSYFATKKALRYIEEIKPDIIHLHNLHGCYLNYKILLSYLSKKNIPVVYTLHDCWSMTGHCGHFTYFTCNKWKKVCYQCPAIKQSRYNPFVIDNTKYNYLLKRDLFNKLPNLTIVPVSDWLENVVRESYLQSKSIQTIYNGINTNIFKPKDNINYIKVKYNIPSNMNIILAVANVWDNRKGLADIIELNNILPDENQIIIVGYISHNQKKKLPTNFILIERTENQEELASLYSLADVYFNPSIQETFGLTTVEALACGTPVIVYNSTASPELVSADVGYVVEAHNHKQTLDALNEILKNGKKIYHNNCRKRVLDFYTEEIQMEHYLNLYNILLS